MLFSVLSLFVVIAIVETNALFQSGMAVRWKFSQSIFGKGLVCGNIYSTTFQEESGHRHSSADKVFLSMLFGYALASHF